MRRRVIYMPQRLILKYKINHKKINFKKIFLYNSINCDKFLNRWLLLWENPNNRYMLKSVKKLRTKSLELNKTSSLLSLKWLKFLNIYNVLMLRSFYILFSYIRENDKLMYTNNYLMYFNFNKTRMYVNIHKGYKTNYLSLSVGLFLKFLKNKRSLKKTKTLKVLLIKYLRKLCIITNFKYFDLHVRRVPLYLQELVRLLMKPLSHPFVNPFNNKTIDETRGHIFTFKFRTVVFNKNKPYFLPKVRKKGRVKRKITKRIVKMNSLVD